MLSTSTSASAPAAAPTFTDADVIDRAVALLKQTNLSEADQLTIEHTIGLMALKYHCNRLRGAQILHRMAYPV